MLSKATVSQGRALSAGSWRSNWRKRPPLRAFAGRRARLLNSEGAKPAYPLTGLCSTHSRHIAIVATSTCLTLSVSPVELSSGKFSDRESRPKSGSASPDRLLLQCRVSSRYRERPL